MTSVARLSYTPVPGADEVFTEPFVDYLLALHRSFTPRVHALRAERMAMLKHCLESRTLPVREPDAEVRKGDWRVPPLPAELRTPGIEISGPASVTSMFINALNPGPDGTRAEGDLDDDEDSAGHLLTDTVRAAINRRQAVERTLTYHDAERDRHYAIQDGAIPFFMHRERGLMLDEPDVSVGGTAVPAGILGTALTLFHAGKAHVDRGQGIYFYLPKMEAPAECALWMDFFDASRELVPHLRDAVIRAIPLIESLPAAFQMEEMLHALGPYGAGLNAARWDLKASILEYVLTDADSVWPDRFGVDIKTTEFLSGIFRHLVAVCLKRGAVPIGGMATALPSRDEEVNAAAAASIRADKQWEASQGFVRAWVAHIFHMKAAADPFKELSDSGWEPTTAMRDPANYPIEVRTPEGAITIEGTRRNARTIIEYVEGWLNGRGAKGIDSLAGRPGVHPALMEDLATARISVAQTAQRILHGAVGEDTGQAHDFALVKGVLASESIDIIRLLDGAGGAEAEARYQQAVKVALRWIKNYTDLDFRSLGSYTRAELAVIGGKADAF